MKPLASVLLLGLALPLFTVGLALTAVMAGGEDEAGVVAPSAAAGDIPSAFLRLYQAAARRYGLGADGWSYLAGVGKIECDHGRSTAVGCDRGEQNFAGAAGPAQFLRPTWAAYGVDADGDGRRDLYDPADAIYGMANYLKASGAPGDWRRALFAYNHLTAYVDDVIGWAERYRTAPTSTTETTQVAGSGGWLVPLPGRPGIRCDARIVADVLALERRWGIATSACFGGAPHATLGEHPLGLAIDAVPSDGNWDRTMALSRSAGWSEGCAARGCPGVGPFRVVLYNGYPSHGDPQHSRIPHLHLSWDHAPAQPFTRAAWVRTISPAPAARPGCASTGSSTRSRRGGAGRRCRG